MQRYTLKRKGYFKLVNNYIQLREVVGVWAMGASLAKTRSGTWYWD